MSLSKKSSKKYIDQERKSVLLQSDSLTKVYELSVAKLLDIFRHSKLNEDEAFCYMACIKAFCKHEPFKFDKQTQTTMLDLTQSAFGK